MRNKSIVNWKYKMSLRIMLPVFQYLLFRTYFSQSLWTNIFISNVPYFYLTFYANRFTVDWLPYSVSSKITKKLFHSASKHLNYLKTSRFQNWHQNIKEWAYYVWWRLWENLESCMMPKNVVRYVLFNGTLNMIDIGSLLLELFIK